MMESGLMIRELDMAYIIISMVTFMRDFLLMANEMEKVLSDI